MVIMAYIIKETKNNYIKENLNNFFCVNDNNKSKPFCP